MAMNQSKKPRRIGVLVGSLRGASFSRRLAKALIARAPSPLACAIIEIADLPLYNEDLDGSPPPAWVAFRKAIRACDALLFVTPEYNRSVPGCLKNATDIGSRPEGKTVFDGLPAAIVSVSPYALGGFGANHALRQSFVYLNLAVMQQPEAYVGDIGDAMNDDGEITDAKTAERLATFMEAFATWTAVHTQSPEETFEDFLVRREAISGDYIRGDAGPLREISATVDPVTFFPPSGDRIQGAAAVNAANEKAAKAFGKGSKGHFEIMQSAASGTLGFWTGVQHADVTMAGKDKPVKMELRITEIFGVEDGAWRLVHRHADMVGNDK
jgi:NAD(P)H-dependent FMN reductase/ketosteroid isomerase-like protein